MKKKYLTPHNFTKKTGAYSHGISVDCGDHKIIFVTGQIAMDEWGNAVAPGDFSKQTKYIFENIKTILAEDYATFHDVVKVVIYTTDMSKFSDVSKIRNKYLSDSLPVSTLVEITGTVKKGCDVEVEVVAMRRKRPPV